MSAPTITRDEFLQRRRKGIGGSDMAAILGLSPYKTPFAIWQDKTGRAIDHTTPEQEERMGWGNILEDVVARHYADKCGRRVQRINQQMQHKRWPVIIGNVDRVCVQQGTQARWDSKTGRVLGADAVLEVKTASAFAARDSDNWGEPGTDAVPQHYWMQVQHYLGITGLPVADLAVLFGGQQFRTYTIHADTALHDDMFAQAADWWERHVVADVPPDPTTEEEARLAWKTARAGATLVADYDTAQAVYRLQEVKRQIDELKTEEAELRDRICPVFQDAEILIWQGQKLATWKANKPSAKTDWKAVATALGADTNLIAQHTTTTEGARVLRLVSNKE